MRSIEDVRNMIHDAFAADPIPSPKRIVSRATGQEREPAETLRRELARKHWTELTDDFLEQRRFSFCYLSAEGYRHYLPALLDAGLRRFDSEEHFALFRLEPSAHAMYYHGKDRHFDRQVSLLTEPQARAVSAFLGLFVKDKPNYWTFYAARAMRWGWGRCDTPERRTFDAFDRRMRSYEIPETIDPAVADPDAEEVVREIREAFADTPYPGDHNLCGSSQGDEPAECAMELRGVRWQNADPELLAAYYTALSFLTAEGLRYFLPAYLIADLASPVESNAIPLYTLTHGFYTPDKPLYKVDVAALEKLAEQFPILGTVSHMQDLMAESEERHNQIDWFEYASERMSVYSLRERQAIVRYLKYCQETGNFSSGEIAEALERYWLPSLNGG